MQQIDNLKCKRRAVASLLRQVTLPEDLFYERLAVFVTRAMSAHPCYKNRGLSRVHPMN